MSASLPSPDSIMNGCSYWISQKHLHGANPSGDAGNMCRNILIMLLIGIGAVEPWPEGGEWNWTPEQVECKKKGGQPLQEPTCPAYPSFLRMNGLHSGRINTQAADNELHCMEICVQKNCSAYSYKWSEIDDKKLCIISSDYYPLDYQHIGTGPNIRVQMYKDLVKDMNEWCVSNSTLESMMRVIAKRKKAELGLDYTTPEDTPGKEGQETSPPAQPNKPDKDAMTAKPTGPPDQHGLTPPDGTASTHAVRITDSPTRHASTEYTDWPSTTTRTTTTDEGHKELGVSSSSPGTQPPLDTSAGLPSPSVTAHLGQTSSSTVPTSTHGTSQLPPSPYPTSQPQKPSSVSQTPSESARSPVISTSTLSSSTPSTSTARPERRSSTESPALPIPLTTSSGEMSSTSTPTSSTASSDSSSMPSPSTKITLGQSASTVTTSSTSHHADFEKTTRTAQGPTLPPLTTGFVPTSTSTPGTSTGTSTSTTGSSTLMTGTSSSGPTSTTAKTTTSTPSGAPPSITSGQVSSTVADSDSDTGTTIDSFSPHINNTEDSRTSPGGQEITHKDSDREETTHNQEGSTRQVTTETSSTASTVPSSTTQVPSSTTPPPVGNVTAKCSASECSCPKNYFLFVQNNNGKFYSGKYSKNVAGMWKVYGLSESSFVVGLNMDSFICMPLSVWFEKHLCVLPPVRLGLYKDNSIYCPYGVNSVVSSPDSQDPSILYCSENNGWRTAKGEQVTLISVKCNEKPS